MKNRFFSLVAAAALVSGAACDGDNAEVGDGATLTADTSTIITQDTAAVVTTTTVDTIAVPDSAETDTARADTTLRP